MTIPKKAPPTKTQAIDMNNNKPQLITTLQLVNKTLLKMEFQKAKSLF